MSFIDDDGKLLPTLLAADLIQDERKLLNRGDDDLLPLGDEFAEVTGVFGMPDSRTDLGKLLDRVADLFVEDAPVGHHDDRVEHDLVILA